MKKVEKQSISLCYTIILSVGVLGFVISKEPLFLILGALLAVLILVFKK